MAVLTLVTESLTTGQGMAVFIKTFLKMSNSRKGITVKISSWVQKLLHGRSIKEQLSEQIEELTYAEYVKRTQLSKMLVNVKPSSIKESIRSSKNDDDCEEAGCLILC